MWLNCHNRDLSVVFCSNRPFGILLLRYCHGGLAVMRYVSFAAVLAASIITFSQIVSAADLPVKAQPLPPPAPVYNWTGFYAGVNAGGGWGNYKVDNTLTPGACTLAPALCTAVFAATVPGQFASHPTSFIGGVQIGYNYQFARNWVAGLEADFQGSDFKSAASVTNSANFVTAPTGTVTLTSSASQKLDWFGTLRGRLGWLPVDPLLIYATGGLAYGHTETSVSYSGQTTSLGALVENGPLVSNSQSKTPVGWTVGGGVEWMFAPRWSLKAEYLYYDLSVTLDTVYSVTNVAGNVFNHSANIQSVAHYAGNIARVGVNYKFY